VVHLGMEIENLLASDWPMGVPGENRPLVDLRVEGMSSAHGSNIGGFREYEAIYQHEVS